MRIEPITCLDIKLVMAVFHSVAALLATLLYQLLIRMTSLQSLIEIFLTVLI